MPNKNGTGPEGKGPRTGRGLGPCGDDVQRGDGRGRGRGAGLGLRRNANADNEKRDKNN